MARRAKPAAEPAVSLAPPSSPHPPGGYDVRTIAEAAEIMRHQSHVLEVRAPVAPAAGGVRPLRSEQPADVPVAGLGLEAREAALTAREARVLEEEQRAADAAVELERDRRMLGVREEELAGRDAAQRTEMAKVCMHVHGLDTARAALQATARSLEEREQSIDARATTIEGREQEIALREAEVAERESMHLALGQRQARIASETDAQEPVARPPDGIARFNVETLSSLVSQRGGKFPGRVDEWRWTIISLRRIADISGALPHTVDGFVRDVFEPLLG